MKQHTYMVLLADRQKAKMFTLIDGAVEEVEEITNGHVPQNVRANEERYYGRSDKIFRHIEDHLHRHLMLVSKKASHYAKRNKISNIVIGSHKPLFAKIKKHLNPYMAKQVKGTFVTELKAPFNEILKRAEKTVSVLEAKKI